MNRADISKRNEWWIEKHRYYELKHFCQQYDIWKNLRDSTTGLAERSGDILGIQTFGIAKPVEKAAIAREHYDRMIRLVERAAAATDPVLGGYILIGVTGNYAYETLRARTDVPCCKRTYYQLCRKFFWILNQLRG